MSFRSGSNEKGEMQLDKVDQILVLRVDDINYLYFLIVALIFPEIPSNLKREEP